MQLNQNIKLHNRFDIEVRDSKTGTLKQTAVAHNILLDQIYTRLCAGNSYFVNIHFGTGTTTPVPSRTSLNNHLGTKVAVLEEVIKAFPISIWKQKITLVPSEYVGSGISEVGIAFGSGVSNAVTHALLKDAEGNPISINKTATDTVIIYATVFVTFTNNYENFNLLNMPNGNSLVNYLVGGSAAPTGTFRLKRSLYESSLSELGASTNVVWTSDVPNKRRRTDIKRFDISDANGHVQALEFGNMFRLGFPSEGVHPGQHYQDVSIGVGDGSTREFILPSDNVLDETIEIKTGGTLNTNYEKLSVPGREFVLSQEAIDTLSTANRCTLNADGTVIAFSRPSNQTSPYVKVYDKVGVEWVTRLDPPGVSTASDVALNADGTVLAVAMGTVGPRVQVYEWVDENWVVRPTPLVTPLSQVNSVALSDNGKVLAIGGASAPCVKVFDWDDGDWVSRATPTGMSSNAISLALSADGSVFAAAFQSSTPLVQISDWIDGNWVARPRPAGVTNAFTVSLSANGAVLAIGRPGAPTFDWIDGDWVARPSPPTISSSPDRVKISADGLTLATGTNSQAGRPSLHTWNGTLWGSVEFPVNNTTSVYVGLAGDGNTFIVADSSREYTRGLTTSHRIIFSEAPALGDIITADYTVKGVHKTVNSVIDVSFAIQFGEGV